MAESRRKKIGLIFYYDENWIAGAYYILNLIRALNLLRDEEKPELYLITFTQEDRERILKETKYPFLNFLPYEISCTLPERVINIIFRMFTGKNPIVHRYPADTLDMIFPALELDAFQNIKNKVQWIPDFQEKHLPGFFSNEEIKRRDTLYKSYVSKNSPVIFSSKSAENDFLHFYPDSKASTYVLHFAVVHPLLANAEFKSVQDKYKIQTPYFFCPNQLWAHKDHITLLEALCILRDRKNICPNVYFSGKESDDRNPSYPEKVKKFILENELTSQVKFLGFIDRADQLAIMKNSLAIIQPSLFEGWSTVVEDAKAMNQLVILSDLPVHREQMNYNCSFFDPGSAGSLASAIETFLSQKPQAEQRNYSENQITYAKRFLEITSTILKEKK